MGMPKLGMHYEDVRKKLRRLGSDPALRNSLLNQCQLHEGETATNELKTELSVNANRVSAFSGAGTKQLGWGEGKKLGAGRWKFLGNKWTRVE